MEEVKLYKCEYAELHGCTEKLCKHSIPHKKRFSCERGSCVHYDRTECVEVVNNDI